MNHEENNRIPAIQSMDVQVQAKHISNCVDRFSCNESHFNFNADKALKI